MPVQIPELKRFNPVEPSEQGQIKTDLPEGLRPLQKQQAAVENIGEDLLKHFQQEEDNEIEKVVLSESGKYERDMRMRLEEIEKIQGDPTELYSELDKYDTEVEKKYLEPHSGRIHDELEKAIIRKRGTLNTIRASSQAIQNANYWKKVADESVENEHMGMMDATQFVRAHEDDEGNRTLDESTVGGIEKHMAEIESIRIKQGLQNGLAVKNEDGSIRKSILLDAQIKDDYSKGLVSVIKTINAIDPELGEQIRKKYEHFILPDKRADLYHDGRVSAINRAGVALGQQYAAHPQGLDMIMNSDAPPMVKKVAVGMFNQVRYAREGNRNSKSMDNYSYLYDLAKSGGYVNFDAFKADPQVQGRWNSLTPAHKKALEKDVEGGPETSDPEELARLWKMMSDGEFVGKDPVWLESQSGDITKADRKVLMSELKKQNTQSGPERAEMFHRFGNMFEEQVRVQRKTFGLSYKKKTNKWGSESEIKFNQMKNKFLDTFAGMPDLPYEQQRKFVNDYLTTLAHGEAYKPQFAPQIKSAPSRKPEAAPTSTPAPIKKKRVPRQPLTDEQKKAWLKKFNEVRGVPYNKDEHGSLYDFIDSQGGKL